MTQLVLLTCVYDVVELTNYFVMKKKVLFVTCTVLLSFFLCIILPEIALRFLGLPFKEIRTPPETSLGKFDRELGWAYIPNNSVTQEFGNDARKVAMHFDSIGARVGSLKDKRDHSLPSVVFVGGSYTMGHGVPYEESFVGLLDANPEFPFEVINLGVQAYGTDQALIQLKRHLNKFNAKKVVYTFLFNHLRRNTLYDRRVLFPEARFLGTKPLFKLKSNGELYLAKKPLKYEEYQYSHLLAYLRMFILLFNKVDTNDDLTRALINEMKNYSESHGADFFVINWDQNKNLGMKSPCEGMDIEVIETNNNPPPGWSKWKIPGDNHPSFKAHRYVAEILARRLTDKL